MDVLHDARALLHLLLAQARTSGSLCCCPACLMKCKCAHRSILALLDHITGDLRMSIIDDFSWLDIHRGKYADVPLVSESVYMQVEASEYM